MYCFAGSVRATSISLSWPTSISGTVVCFDSRKPKAFAYPPIAPLLAFGAAQRSAGTQRPNAYRAVLVLLGRCRSTSLSTGFFDLDLAFITVLSLLGSKIAWRWGTLQDHGKVKSPHLHRVDGGVEIQIHEIMKEVWCRFAERFSSGRSV